MRSARGVGTTQSGCVIVCPVGQTDTDHRIPRSVQLQRAERAGMIRIPQRATSRQYRGRRATLEMPAVECARVMAAHARGQSEQRESAALRALSRRRDSDTVTDPHGQEVTSKNENHRNQRPRQADCGRDVFAQAKHSLSWGRSTTKHMRDGEQVYHQTYTSSRSRKAGTEWDSLHTSAVPSSTRNGMIVSRQAPSTETEVSGT
ncbi:hypothetical protein ACROYT_G020767 [Oculina patagonica]